MKKFFKSVVTLLLALGACGSLFGCTQPSVGGDPVEQVDETRTQLYVYNYDGGFGSAWLNEVKERYEALHAEDVYEPGTGKRGIQIMVNNSKTAVTSSSILANRDEVYFTENMYYYTLRYDGVLADITDAVTGANPYEAEKTVESKFTEQQKQFYGIEDAREDGKTQYLGIPHYAGSYGLVYDADLFEQKGYYFRAGYKPDDPLEEKFIYEAGDTRSAGPDGVSGTDDDGLPATYEEFFWLCRFISDNGQIPISWTGQYYTQYLGNLLNALVADYEGVEQMMLNFSFDGTNATDLGTIVNGVFVEDEKDTPITEDNPEEVRRQAGIYYALEFLEELIDNAEANKDVSGNVFNSSYSHLDNQTDFLMSRAEGSKPIAMMVDGMWWQSEAENVFQLMETQFDAEEFSKEARDIRWMPLPKAAPEKAGKSTLYDCLYSLSFVKSNIAAWKLPIAIDFLQFVNTDESLREFTLLTNAAKALNYEMGDKLNEMSPYGRSLIAYREKCDIVYPYSRSELYVNNQSSFRSDEMYRSTVNNATKNYPALAFHVDGVSAAEYFTGIYTYYKDFWADLT